MVDDEGRVARGPGRPRDPRIEEAILLAARRRLVSDGYAQMTLADVAKDAGVSRPTIYLRFPTKHDLVVAALDYGVARDAAGQDADALTALPAAEGIQRALEQSAPGTDEVMVITGNLMAESARHPGLLELFRRHGIAPRVERVLSVLTAARDDGDLPPGTDVTLLTDMLLGAYFAAYLRGAGSTEDLAERLVAMLPLPVQGGEE